MATPVMEKKVGLELSRLALGRLIDLCETEISTNDAQLTGISPGGFPGDAVRQELVEDTLFLQGIRSYLQGRLTS